MGRANPTVLLGFFVAVIVTLCGAALLKGGFYLGKHEGDTFHLLQIVFRMAEGQLPHLDFMTPIGVLAFAPIALFVSLGYGAGTAIFLGQALIALIFLPAVWWIAYSRMRGLLGYVFGLIIFVLITALVHGEADRSVSISMHYNRWAWAAAFIVIAAAVLPAIGRERPRIDGLIIGLGMVFLLLTKLTYFAAFALPILIALLARRSFTTLGYAIVSAGVAVAGVTLWTGYWFWLAYLRDLLTVMQSEGRPNPGVDFGSVVGSPAYLGASLVLITSIILLRQSKQAFGGMILLFLMPAFFYVTYQNFANDPQWLLLLGVLLLAFLPAGQIRNGLGWDMRSAIKTTVAVTFALTAPSFLNLAYSPFRHYFVDTEKYTPLLARDDIHSDIQTLSIRAARANITIPLQVDGEMSARYAERADRAEPTVFKGETLPNCELSSGLTAWFDFISTDLSEAGLARGKTLFAADLFSSHWLFGELEPVQGGAPWYYGGLPGLQNADYLLVPLCPLAQKARAQIVEAIEDAGLEFNEIRRTSLYILYEPAGVQTDG